MGIFISQAEACPRCGEIIIVDGGLTDHKCKAPKQIATRRHLGEGPMLNMLEHLLCLEDEEEYVYETVRDLHAIKFHGNIYNVRHRLIKWLNTPERADQTKLLMNE